MDNEENLTSTDKAILECDQMIKKHHSASNLTVYLGVGAVAVLLVTGLVIVGASLGLDLKPVALNQKPVALNQKPVALDQKSVALDQKSVALDQKSVASTYALAALDEKMVASPQLSSAVLFGFFAIFVIVFSVFTAIYRFHLNEISKAEHYKLGFMRIRIAGANTKPAYQSEVRKALTEHAFAYEKPSHGLFKNKHVESPLPGHPTADITTHLLDKLLDKFELVERKPKE